MTLFLSFGQSNNLNLLETRGQGQRRWDNGEKEIRRGSNLPWVRPRFFHDSVNFIGETPNRTISGENVGISKTIIGCSQYGYSPNFHVCFWCLLQIQCPHDCITSLSPKLCPLIWTFSFLTIKYSWSITSRNALC